MSTEIKPGQVWASMHNAAETATVREVRGNEVWATDDQSGSHFVRASLGFRCDYELVKEPPAPLDPSKGGPFGGGDSVRYVGPPHRSYVAVGVIPGRVFTVRDGTDVENGVISLFGSSGMFPAIKFELVARATDHQPAPEPEPELPIKSGSVVVDVDHDMRYFRANGLDYPWVSETGTWESDEYVSRLNWRAVEEAS